ncbi:MAG: polysaccharide deacetylase family protein [Candidatus Paceibacterota bacterium]
MFKFDSEIKKQVSLIIVFTVFIVMSYFFNAAIYTYKQSKQQTALVSQEFISTTEKTNTEILKNQPTEITPEGSIKVPIIVYHSVRPYYEGQTLEEKEFSITPDSFEKQLQYLKDNGYTTIALQDIALSLTQNKKLPLKPISINFDDGWENQYVYAFPLLKKYGFTATFFVYTNTINHRNYLTLEQLLELDRAGMEIGDHTKSHPYLFKITDPIELREEIVVSKENLEKILGKKVNVFSYPFGNSSPESIEIIKEAGFTLARTGYWGKYHTLNDIYTIKSMQVSEDFEKFLGLLK